MHFIIFLTVIEEYYYHKCLKIVYYEIINFIKISNFSPSDFLMTVKSIGCYSGELT